MSSHFYNRLRQPSLSPAQRIFTITFLLTGLCLAMMAWPLFKSYAALGNIVGPPGSVSFGTTITVLPNGNIVITDPNFTEGGIDGLGAVYLYDGATLALISTLKGSQLYDLVGNNGITVLGNGNFVVSSPSWSNGVVADTGAISFCSATTGCNGVVSSANSLVGVTANDFVGGNPITVLSNGNFVVNSPIWNNGAITDAGAVTFCNGITGCSGAITTANSLVGTTASDLVGATGSTALPNGNYVVSNLAWNNGAAIDAGAITFCNGATGCIGTVNASNSLVGTTSSDLIGASGIAIFPNGNYLVRSGVWDNASIVDAGAVTLCNGTTGCTGTISAANSLVGATAGDLVGGNEVTLLPNGNYVVTNPFWDNPALAKIDVGAATLCNGTSGCTGTINAGNSLLGTSTGDSIGSITTIVLQNGNYAVRSPVWDNGATTDVGAVTWCNGATGCTGVVSTSNSLFGANANDLVGGNAVSPLSNGNFVVTTPLWDSGANPDVGAVTLCNGNSGCNGAVTAANSLIGSTTFDLVGSRITELTNGNFVVNSPLWDHGAIVDVGAVTFCNGLTGCIGAVTATNSLIGSTPNDLTGGGGITALPNGNYVVLSPIWNNSAVVDAGAVTFCNGNSGCTGAVSPTNSLVGTTSDDYVGVNGVTVLSNGNYVVNSSNWNNGATSNAGAVTFCNGLAGCHGAVTTHNSLVGGATDDILGYNMATALPNGNYLVRSVVWNSTAMANVAALSYCNGSGGCSGVISAANSFIDQAGNGIGVTAYDNVRDRLFFARGTINTVSVLTANKPPTITSIPATIVEGTSLTNTQIATASDPEDAANLLTVAISSDGVNFANAATINGVTVTLTNSHPDNLGKIFANIAAACGATNANFTLCITDSGGSFITTPFAVTVTPQPTPTISINDVTSSEGTGAGTTVFTFDVTLNQPNICKTITVNYATANGTATATDNDYAAASGTITFNPGVTSQNVTINVNRDAKAEANETFFVNLTSPVNATLADAQGLGTILNDDAPPQIQVVVGDPQICLTPEGLVQVTATITNTNAVAVAADFAATLPTTLNGLPGTGSVNVNPAGLTVAASFVTWTGTVNAGQTVTISYKTQIAANAPAGLPICIKSQASFEGGIPAEITECVSLGCPAELVNIGVSDQKAGAVLVFPYYTSKAAEKKDTRLTLSNIGDQTAYVHLFFIDGASCQQADYSACITPNGSFTFKASEVDGETTGWLFAVAVDAQGRPTQYNGLIGNAFVLDGAYQDSYGAQAFRALSDKLATINGNTATLFFDGASYDAVPNQFAAEIQSPLDTPNQRLITVGLRGDLSNSGLTGAAQQGVGFAYNAQERGGSFQKFLTGNCFAETIITATNPRIPSTLGVMIGAGNSGHLRFSIGAGVGLLMTPKTAKWNGIRTLHSTALTTSTITIPLSIPQC